MPTTIAGKRVRYRLTRGEAVADMLAGLTFLTCTTNGGTQ